MSKVQASARVQITVEFAVGGSVWGDDCSIEQVHKQAHEGAVNILRQGLIIDGLTGTTGLGKVHADIVGEPKVTAILVERQGNGGENR